MRIAGLALLAGSTIVLGLQNLDFWLSIGFVALALGTFVTGLESFFNWRSRWVLSEEAQYRFYRLQDELEYLLASRDPESITFAELQPLFERYQDAWDRFSLGWLEERKRAGDGSAI